MKTGRPSARATVSCLVAGALFGAGTPACKALLNHDMPPVLLAGLLYCGAAVGVAPWAFRPSHRAARPDRTNTLRLLGAIMTGGILAPVLVLLALRVSSSAPVALGLSLETLATMAIAALFFHDHLGRRGMLGAALLVAATLMLGGHGEGALRVVPLLLVALSCTCWGIDNNLTSLIDGLTPARTVFIKGLVAGTFNTTLGLALGGRASLRDVALALGVGVISYGLSITLYVSGAQALGAARSQALFLVDPFLGAALSWLWLGESATAAQIAACVVLVAGLVLLLTGRHSHEHQHEAMRHLHAHRHDDGHHEHVHEGLPASTWHAHEHDHEAATHSHPHVPDLHHRHVHGQPLVHDDR